MEVKITDATVFVDINKPKTAETVGQYFSEEIQWRVQQQLDDWKPLDFAFDIYKTGSIKGQTREGSGIFARIIVKKEPPIAKKFQIFLKNSDNKTELFKMLDININKI